MSSQQETDLLCLVGRCLLASIDHSRTNSLHGVLVAIRSYLDSDLDSDDLLTNLEHDIEVEKHTPSELTFLLKFFVAETLEEDISRALTLECSVFSGSQNPVNKFNLESNIHKCVQTICHRWTLNVVTDIKAMKLHGLRSLIKLKEYELKSIIQDKNKELIELRIQETNLCRMDKDNI